MRVSGFGVLALAGVMAALPRVAEACQPRLANGSIELGAGLTVTEGGAPARLAPCLQPLAAALAARPWIRAVTVVARATDEQRIAGHGLATARAVVAELEGVGVGPGLVSAVSVAGDGDVVLRYREVAGPVLARIDVVTGDVDVGREEAEMSAAAQRGEVRGGEIVRTGAGASARLILVGGATLQLGARSVVRIEPGEGGAWARVHLDAGHVLVAMPEDAAGHVPVHASGAAIFARGARFRLRHLRAERSPVLEVVAGEVDLNGRGVSAGQGVTLSGGTASPVDLPGPPSWARVEPAGGALAWPRADGAVGYRVELARDADFAAGYRVLGASRSPVALPPSLEPGHWFWRVSSVAPGGLAGPPGKTYELNRPSGL